MLLETLDILKNDVVIFSENKFNFHKNFKVIFKREKVKKISVIDYFEVCKFVRDPVPKNLIVYRLLTNVKSLNAYSTKYGYFVRTDSGMELIYFDPIFALKDIPNLEFDLDPRFFRFKIQQVGFTSIISKDEEASYSEVYSFDLRAIEAQNQNDRIFAEAIFALDNSFVDSKDESSLKSTQMGPSPRAFVEDSHPVKSEFIKADLSRINNDIDYNQKNIEQLKSSIQSDWQTNFDAYNQFKLESHQASLKESKRKKSFSQFIAEHRTTTDDSGIMDSVSKLKDKRDDSVVLRFED